MSTTDVARLQYVAANFRNLQGLRMVAFGVFILIVFFPWRRPGDLTIAAILLLPGLAGFIYAWQRIGAWYDLRFGHVDPKRVPWYCVIYGILLFGIFPWLLHPGSLESFSAYMKGFGGEWWMGWVFVVLAILYGRWYYLPFGLAFLLLGLLRTRGVTVNINGGPDGFFGILLGVTYIVTGLADHFYLIRTLPTLGPERHA